MPNITPITVNGYSLDSSASVIASLTTHDSAPGRDLSKVVIARRDGALITNANYAEKPITIEGALLLKNQTDFEQVVDDFKRSVVVDEGNLDIPYWNGTRRYKVSTQNVAISRDPDNIEWAPYSVEFVATNPPFGFDPITTRAYSFSQINSVTYSNSVYFGGSAEPKPRLIVDINSGSKLTDIQFKTLGTKDRIQFSDSTFRTGDTYVIDTNTLTVQKNGGQYMDYNGKFPRFTPNQWNGFELSFLTAQGGLSIDQQQVSGNKFVNTITSNVYFGQSFTPSITGDRYSVDLVMQRNPINGTTNTTPIVVEIQDNDGSANGLPNGNVLATGTIQPGTLTNSFAIVNVRFATPPTLTAGTKYHYVIKTNQIGVAMVYNDGNLYTGGRMNLSTNNGSSWAPYETGQNDLIFRDLYTQNSPAYNVAIAFDYERRWI